SKLITSLVRDAHTTPTSPSSESNTLMIGKPLDVLTTHIEAPSPDGQSATAPSQPELVRLIGSAGSSHFTVT
ncbi:hypothetical protein, partial [Streptomyces sp. NPDC057325]|uniref:hypothetical protein n=1 Tax=unclassified Streptomyces TaxID=2593676 RepID=UPI003634CA19